MCNDDAENFCEVGKMRDTWILNNLSLEEDRLVLEIFDTQINKEVLFVYDFYSHNLNWLFFDESSDWFTKKENAGATKLCKRNSKSSLYDQYFLVHFK